MLVQTSSCLKKPLSETIVINEIKSANCTDVDDYIEFYNHRRFHETLAYKKPMDVYQESIKLNQEKAKAS
jgi:putative transposase